MTFTLAELPYAIDALEPYISQKTIEYHYGKHHQAYVNNLNNLIPGSDQNIVMITPRHLLIIDLTRQGR